MRNAFYYLFSAILLIACSSDEPQDNEKIVVKPGSWRVEMDLKGQILPFNFILLEKDGKYSLAIVNAKENFKVNDITRVKDSLFVRIPVFDSEFKAKIIDSANIEGVWINHYISPQYKVPFKASYGENYRFTNATPPLEEDISGKYEVTFSPGREDEYKAIGIIKQDANEKHRITGTFITETGDYRHLEGNYTGDSVFMSTFDGAHAFLFKAKNENFQLNGMFYSGYHFQEPWVAVKNESFELRDPYKLTYLKEGYDEVSFTFPNLEGEMVSLKDKKYENKVVIVQLMGSWCPNCMDETIYFAELYDKYNKNGLEIIALAFERTDDKERAKELVRSLKQTYGADYDFLIASHKRKVNMDTILPSLNHVMSFPTAIFIDKNKNVRQIHTGFYGPGTGDYYIRYRERTDAFLRSLLGLKEKATN